MLVFTILGGLLFAVRRRLIGLLMGAVVLVLGTAAPQQAQAQGAPYTVNMNIEQFTPMGGAQRVWSVANSAVAPAWLPYVSLLFHGQTDSLTLQAGGHTEELVANQQTADMMIGMGLFDILQLEVGLPYVIGLESDQAPPDGPLTSINPVSGGGLSDLYVRLKAQILNNRLGGFGLGLLAGVTAPIGDSDKFRGDPGVGVVTRLIADYRAGGTVLTFNLGARIRTEEVEFITTTFGNELTYGIGVDIEVAPSILYLATEFFGSTDLENPFQEKRTSGLEFMFGPKWWFVEGVSLQAAVGAGLVEGIGTPDFRFLVGLQWAPESNDIDKDGVTNREDLCPREPEDLDGFADQDGCPDEDNDRDGILDAVDECPNRPETYDGVDDEDGCPEIAQLADKDLDGIPDDRDQCPEIPETVNGFEDGDGCRDEVPKGGGGSMFIGVNDPECAHGITEAIPFSRNSDALSQAAKNVMFEVAHKINNNPYIVFVSVNGHASADEGGDVAALKLSQRRAQAVKKYLTEQVVDQDKMAARGFGTHSPSVESGTPEADSANRRVDFTIELGGKCKPVMFNYPQP